MKKVKRGLFEERLWDEEAWDEMSANYPGTDIEALTNILFKMTERCNVWLRAFDIKPSAVEDIIR